MRLSLSLIRSLVMRKSILERYTRNSEGEVVIEIAAGMVEDLYNHFDRYTPYVKKDLNQDFADYLTTAAEEIGKEPFVIQFHFNQPPEEELRSRVTRSVHNYFMYLKELELRELMRVIRRSLVLLLLGVVILSIALWFSQAIEAQSTVVKRVFAEGLTIAAWVSLWEALATFIINWTPYRRQFRLYERIAQAPIKFNASP